MQIGIVSDIHGNAAGLSRALDLMGDVDELWCAGDVVEEYRFSNEAVSILRDRGARCVLGNHDLGLLSPHGERARSADHVDADLLAWLAAQPLTIDTVIDGHRLIMTHASPCPPHNQYVMPQSPELRRIGEVAADVVIIGHSHRQMIERVGRVLVVNPGSVGQARDPRNGRQLSYAVLTVTADDIDVSIEDFTIPLVADQAATGEAIPADQRTTPALAGAGGTS